jgi:uncharacterized protein
LFNSILSGKMEQSRFNIISEIKDSDQYFIINSLYGSADIIDRDTYNRLISGLSSDDELSARGYLVNPEEEKAIFREAYLRFLDDRETDEVQLFFVPDYSCNFNCSYCYQGEYENRSGGLRSEIIDAFFRYIDIEFADRRKYITLFGGEPLLNGRRQRENVETIIERAAERNIQIAIVTNGYHIPEYLDLLRKAPVREIQVTLDGTREVHDKRRALKNGEGTFDRIVEGMELLLTNGIPVNLRMVADRDNIDNLPALAQFAIDRGWTAYDHFSTQIGRNYELHDCQSERGRLFSRIEMYGELYRLIKEFPHIMEFHKPAFAVSRALYENGELPAPLFDACPGTKTEWAFDYKGNIYACTATVGKPGEELGVFFPERELYTDKIEEWEERDILSVKECGDCNLSLICGGGCASVAKNRNGCIGSPDCRPVKELLELGIAAYFSDNY